MISVIIATYNGESVLRHTLQALTLLEKPNQGVEFIFVDNASTDNTANIIVEYADKLPLQLLREDQQGKAYALHKGITQASGDLIIFSDDDIIPDQNWLVAYQEAAKEQEKYSIFLGQIRPFWQSPPPQWLIQLSDEGLACGCTPKDRLAGVASAYWAKGANFCIRKEVINDVMFRLDLWIAGKQNIGGEDTDFVNRAEGKGYKLWFVPEACLQHIIRPNEMTIRGIWLRYFRIGRSIAATEPEISSNEITIGGYPRWAIFKTLKLSASAIMAVIKLNFYKAVSELIVIAKLCGQLYENKHGH